MPEFAVILGKAIVAIFLSLLLNYIYIVRVSRLKKPSDKEVLKSLQIIWEGGVSRERIFRYENDKSR